MLTLKPISIRDARPFVEKWHRHHRPPHGAILALACESGGEIVGVAFLARPKARLLQDGYTMEVTRVATNGHRNACSFLLGAARRTAKALGYHKLITYTLPEEGGASLRASGWVLEAESGGGTWTRADRPRADDHPLIPKFRWSVSFK